MRLVFHGYSMADCWVQLAVWMQLAVIVESLKSVPERAVDTD